MFVAKGTVNEPAEIIVWFHPEVVITTTQDWSVTDITEEHVLNKSNKGFEVDVACDWVAMG